MHGIPIKIPLWDLQFPHQRYWGLRSFGMWCCVIGWVVLSTMKEHSAFIIKSQAVQEEQTAYLLKKKAVHFFKAWGPLTQQHSITSKKNRIVLLLQLIYFLIYLLKQLWCHTYVITSCTFNSLYWRWSDRVPHCMSNLSSSCSCLEFCVATTERH
jgi:hypothetical protein